MKKIKLGLLVGLVALAMTNCGKKEAWKSVEELRVETTILKMSEVKERDAYLKKLSEFDTQLQKVEASSLKLEVKADKTDEDKEKEEALVIEISDIKAEATALKEEMKKLSFEAEILIGKSTTFDDLYHVEVELEGETSAITARGVKYNAVTKELSFSYSVKDEEKGYLHYAFSTTDGKEGFVSVLRSEEKVSYESGELLNLGLYKLMDRTLIQKTDKEVESETTPEEGASVEAPSAEQPAGPTTTEESVSQTH